MGVRVLVVNYGNENVRVSELTGMHEEGMNISTWISALLPSQSLSPDNVRSQTQARVYKFRITPSPLGSCAMQLVDQTQPSAALE